MEIWKLFLIPRLPKWPLGRASRVCLQCSAILLTYHQLHWKLDHLHNRLWGGKRGAAPFLAPQSFDQVGPKPILSTICHFLPFSGCSMFCAFPNSSKGKEANQQH